MVISLLALTAIPTTIAVGNGVSQQKAENRRQQQQQLVPTGDEEKLLRKFGLSCWCDTSHVKKKKRKKKKKNGKDTGKGRARAPEERVHGGRVVLKGGKLFVLPHHTSTSTRPSPHPFAGFYIRYPTSPSPSTSPSHPPPLGLVSTISTSPPLLNWIYIRADTAEVRYGNRTESIVHRVGQWGWVDGDDDDDEGGGESESEGDGGLTLDGREGWVVVEPRGRSGGGGEEGVQGEEGREEVDVNVNVNVNEGEGEEEEGEELWEIRWDENDDLLKGVGAVEGRRVLRISLERRFLDRGEEEGKKEEVEREKGVRGEGVGGG